MAIGRTFDSRDLRRYAAIGAEALRNRGRDFRRPMKAPAENSPRERQLPRGGALGCPRRNGRRSARG
jgi:hypothetical protein